jgi:hypothetical protein
MHTHTKVPTEATIIVSNILPTQVAFGVRMDNGEQCYVPSTVSMAAAMEIGLEYKVKLVQNQDEERAKRTPVGLLYGLTHSSIASMKLLTKRYTN